MTRDRQIAALRSRLDRALGDVPTLHTVLEPSAADEATRLAEIVEPSDLEAAYLLGVLHWTRYQLLPAGSDRPELDAALRWFGRVFPHAPRQVPPALWPALAGSTPPAGVDAAAWLVEALRLLSIPQAADLPEVLSRVVELLGNAVGAVADEDPDRTIYHSALCVALLRRFGRIAQAEDLDAAVQEGERSMETAPANHPDRARVLSNYGIALQSRFDYAGRLQDLHRAIEVSEQSVAAATDGDPDRPSYLSNLNIALISRAESTGSMTDLGRAVNVGYQAIQAVPTDHDDRIEILANHATGLYLRFQRIGNRMDLDRAILFSTQAIEQAPADHPGRAGHLANLGLVLHSRYGLDGQLTDLSDAIRATERALGAAPHGHRHRTMCLYNHGLVLRSRFDRLGQAADLDQAIEVFQQAISVTPHGHRQLAKYLSGLGDALRTRFRRTGDAADLAQAIDATERSVAIVGPSDASRPDYLLNLGLALCERFEASGNLHVLDLAIRAIQESVDDTPVDHPSRARSLTNLGTAMWRRFETTGDLTTIRQAIEAAQQAVDSTSIEQPAHATYLANLAVVLLAEFVHTGDPAAIDRAVRITTQVLEALPLDHPDRGACLTHQAIALWLRFRHTGQLADLDSAIAAGRAAVEAAPDDRADRGGRLSNLGIQLQTRYERTGQPTDLDEAMQAMLGAVAATPPTHPEHATMLANLVSTLRHRFERAGQLPDLDSAIAFAQQSVDATPPGHRAISVRLTNLGNASLARFERTGQLPDLDMAIRAHTDALGALPPGHPDRAARMSNLSDALLAKCGVVEDEQLRLQALGLIRAAAEETTAPPLVRGRSARKWALQAAIASDWDSATTAWGTILEVLPALIEPGLDRGDRQHHLSLLSGLGPYAAACALQTGNAQQAWQRLEQGRGILIGQSLQFRTDTTDLSEAYPELAAEMVRLSRLLNIDTASDALAPTPNPTLAAQIRRQALTDWNALMDIVRANEGFERFAMSPTAEHLQEAATDGAIVAVNVTPYRCDALILTPEGPDVLPLSRLTQDDVVARTSAHLAAVHAASPQTGPDQLRGTLEWLWETVAAPILERLGYLTESPPPRVWPRLWWIPTGPLSLLPLHAAGYHTTAGGHTVLDRVVSSYAPTVQALRHARALPRHRDGRSLVVGISTAPDAPRLHGATREARTVTRRMGTTTQPLLDAAATHEAVTLDLASAAWAHFACHAISKEDPADSHLRLYDRPLYVRDLTRLRLDHSFLAYLSACTTAYGGTRLVDESIHLATAFSVAGFQHVIATLWPIADLVAPRFARLVYDELALGATPAFALHHAVRTARERYQHPSIWASHLHIGA